MGYLTALGWTNRQQEVDLKRIGIDAVKNALDRVGFGLVTPMGENSLSSTPICSIPRAGSAVF